MNLPTEQFLILLVAALILVIWGVVEVGIRHSKGKENRPPTGDA